VPIDLKF